MEESRGSERSHRVKETAYGRGSKTRCGNSTGASCGGGITGRPPSLKQFGRPWKHGLDEGFHGGAHSTLRL
jgi:hypothetical protein